METKKGTSVRGRDLVYTLTDLRKRFQAGELQVRRTYYDYYDSCHPPVETPDAQWVSASDHLKIEDLKKTTTRFSFEHIGAPGECLMRLYTGYCTYELRQK